MRKLLVIVPQDSGVSYHRLTVPHGYLSDCGVCEVHAINSLEGVWVYPKGDNMPDEKIPLWDYVSTFDAVVYSRYISLDAQRQAYILRELRTRGIKTIVDIDDYWHLSASHLLYDDYRANNISAIIEQCIAAADLVTTTHEELRGRILPYNNNVVILPNAIDGRLPQFAPEPTASERVRIGWIGSIHHLCDIELIRDSINKLLCSDIRDSVQFVFGGFDVQQKYYDAVTQTVKPMPYHLQEYVYMERMLTQEYSLIEDERYKRHLLTYTNIPYVGEDDQPYRRLWARDVHQYARMYNELDIVLAPLRNTVFNRCKSPLKLIEAAWFNKPCIVSWTHPFTLDAQHNVNSYCVNEHRTHSDFYKYIRRLVLNPDERTRLGNALHTQLKETYDIHAISERRLFAYEQLYNGKLLMVNG